MQAPRQRDDDVAGISILRKCARLVVAPLHFFSGVAGFWIYRSWHNAAIFAGLWLILAALHRSLELIFREWMRTDKTLLEIPSSYIHLQAIYLAALAGLAVISLFHLLKRRTLVESPRLSHPAVSVLLGLLAIGVSYREAGDAAGWVKMYLRQGVIRIASDASSEPSYYGDVRFADSAMWGQPVFLPYGRDGLIKGRALYEGMPAQITLVAYLDNRYRTPVARSDAQGYFALEAPRGQWEINRISVVLGSGQLGGDDFVVTVLDSDKKAPVLSEVLFGEVVYQGRLSARSVAEPDHDELTLVLRRYMDMRWPLADKQKQPANWENAVIQWLPVAGASEYRVTIFEVKRKSDGTGSARPILRRTGSQPALALKGFRATKSQVTGLEYYVQVEAWSGDGKVLTLSKSWTWNSTFVLQDGLALVPEIDSEGKCGCN